MPAESISPSSASRVRMPCPSFVARATNGACPDNVSITMLLAEAPPDIIEAADILGLSTKDFS